MLICACGAFALIGFPLDDIWHRLFGQDVTLWGPTHLMLIGGAAHDARSGSPCCSSRARAPTRRRPHAPRARLVPIACAASALTGGLLLGLSTFQGEFDFGVPQFRLVFHPMLIAARRRRRAGRARASGSGRGGALGAVGCSSSSCAAVMALIVGAVFGKTTPHFPLYIVEALLVEGVALRDRPRPRRSRFGAVCGAWIGTVGLAAEWALVARLDAAAVDRRRCLPEGAIFGSLMARRRRRCSAPDRRRACAVRPPSPRARSLRCAARSLGAVAIVARWSATRSTRPRRQGRDARRSR